MMLVLLVVFFLAGCSTKDSGVESAPVESTAVNIEEMLELVASAFGEETGVVVRSFFG